MNESKKFREIIFRPKIREIHRSENFTCISIKRCRLDENSFKPVSCHGLPIKLLSRFLLKRKGFFRMPFRWRSFFIKLASNNENVSQRKKKHDEKRFGWNIYRYLNIGDLFQDYYYMRLIFYIEKYLSVFWSIIFCSKIHNSIQIYSWVKRRNLNNIFLPFGEV